MKLKVSIVLFAVLIVSFSLIVYATQASQDNENKNDEASSAFEQQNDVFKAKQTEGTTSRDYNDSAIRPDGDTINKLISEVAKEDRTTWNIEMEFLECTDKAIVIKVTDYDNLGFMYNDLYYKLELFKDGEWVQLSKISESIAYSDRHYVVPSLVEEYVDFNSYSLLSGMPDVTLESGHYRLTKIFNREEISLEFDLNFD